MKALAWTIGALTASLLVLAVALTEHTRSIKPDQAPLLALLVLALLGLADAAVGAMVAARHPRNPVGWLFMLFPLGLSLQFASGAYLTLALPGAGFASWTNHVASAMWFGTIPLALLLFPDGRLPSRRWRRIAWLPLLAFLQAVSFDLFAAAHLEALVLIAYLAALAVAVAALIARFRSSRGVVRLQLEWIAYAGALVVASVLGLLLTLVTGQQQLANLLFFAFAIAFSLVPLAAGLAILRFRLYDIELVIRRTIVYAATTAALAVTFFSLVLLIEAALRPFTAGNELAIAGSTLVTVALFQPLRTRVQHAVDRRFYRSRYDAARTLDAFSVRLRDEVELDAVRADLLDSIDRTVHPASASIWLRGRAR